VVLNIYNQPLGKTTSSDEHWMDKRICHIPRSLLRLKSFLVLFLILYLIFQDPQSVREARQIEQKFIKKWIDQYHKQQPSGGHDDTVDPIIVG
jgi:hypothetical protein